MKDPAPLSAWPWRAKGRPHLEDLGLLLVENADWSREVPEARRVIQIERLGLVIRKDPREHGVLVEVVVRAACQGVELHEVIKVCDLPSPPAGREALCELEFFAAVVYCGCRREARAPLGDADSCLLRSRGVRRGDSARV